MYRGSYYNDPFAALFGGFAAVGIIFLLLFLIGAAVAALFIIARWKLYVKAGHPGWMSLIPVYGLKPRFSVAWTDGAIFWTYFGVMIAAIVLCWVPLLNIVLFVILMVINAMLAVHEAKAYGKGDLFAMGLAIPFSFPVLYIIMGFSKNTQYVGGNPGTYVPAPKAPKAPKPAPMPYPMQGQPMPYPPQGQPMAYPPQGQPMNYAPQGQPVIAQDPPTNFAPQQPNPYNNNPQG